MPPAGSGEQVVRVDCAVQAVACLSFWSPRNCSCYRLTQTDSMSYGHSPQAGAGMLDDGRPIESTY